MSVQQTNWSDSVSPPSHHCRMIRHSGPHSNLWPRFHPGDAISQAKENRRRSTCHTCKQVSSIPFLCISNYYCFYRRTRGKARPFGQFRPSWHSWPLKEALASDQPLFQTINTIAVFLKSTMKRVMPTTKLSLTEQQLLPVLGQLKIHSSQPFEQGDDFKLKESQVSTKRWKLTSWLLHSVIRCCKSATPSREWALSRLNSFRKASNCAACCTVTLWRSSTSLKNFLWPISVPLSSLLQSLSDNEVVSFSIYSNLSEKAASLIWADRTSSSIVYRSVGTSVIRCSQLPSRVSNCFSCVNFLPTSLVIPESWYSTVSRDLLSTSPRKGQKYACHGEKVSGSK